MTPRASKPGADKRGFTAVEIAMVASVIAILALLILPIFRQRAEDARMAAANDELQSLVKALLLVEADIPGGNHLPQLSDLNNLSAPNGTDLGTDAVPEFPGRTRWFNDTSVTGNQPGNSRFVLAGSPEFPQSVYLNTVAPSWGGPYIAVRNSISLNQLATLFPDLTIQNGGVINTNVVGDEYPVDPWGTPYLLYGPEGETRFNFRAVYTVGPDGLPGGEAERGAIGGPAAVGPLQWRRQGNILGDGDDLEFRF